MAIDFFDREVTRLQDRFNDTFGNRPTTCIDAQNAAIMAIAGIGVLARKITRAEDKAAVRLEIQEFMHRKKVMDKFFDRNTQLSTERSNHGTTGKRSDVKRRTAAR